MVEEIRIESITGQFKELSFLRCRELPTPGLVCWLLVAMKD